MARDRRAPDAAAISFVARARSRTTSGNCGLSAPHPFRKMRALLPRCHL
jgi:hypothetical protein